MLREIADGYRPSKGQEPSKAVINLSPADIEEAEKIAAKLGGTFTYEPGVGRGGSVPVTYLLDMLDSEDEYDKEVQERIEAAVKSVSTSPSTPPNEDSEVTTSGEETTAPSHQTEGAVTPTPKKTTPKKPAGV